MIESQSLTVSPSEEQNAIETFQNFGWTLKSTQEVHSKDTHLERGGWNYDQLYSVTETTNYVKLMFQRDTQIPNYNEIAELENEYWSIMTSEPNKPGGTMFWVILSIIGLIFYIIPGAIVIAIRVMILVNYKKKHSEWEIRYNKVPGILEKCRQYMS